MQPRDTSSSCEYLLSMLERNGTNEMKQNETVNRIVRTVAIPFLWLLVKPNGIVLNDIGNIS